MAAKGNLMWRFYVYCPVPSFWIHVWTHCRPQRSCEGYVFTGVCLSTGDVCLVQGGACFQGVCARSGGCLLPGVCTWSQGGVCSRGHLVWGVSALGGVSQHALRQTPPQGRRLLLRTVHILLECILVLILFYSF